MLNGNNNGNRYENKSTKQKVLEIGPAVIATVCLVLSFMIEESTPKMILLIIAAGIGVIAFLIMLIMEIVSRVKKRRNK